ncbi:hypothetical protein OH76DRAFT_1366875 [Lentinus brumalis]|uniref:hAT-like transposase RNase-H fold domain-containing protein n=1 Tax=Lentinus brumalis TaxID=2498619 RepID=A0A371CI78_9APHY|nr:hypothetical protein OH76DRAFT_1366875 [Polyporus brumalis]
MDSAYGLRGYELTAREWKILGQLCDVLKIFKDATMFFSRRTPNISSVIPAIDLIDQALTNGARDTALDPAIRKALGLAKRTLAWYYRMSDMSSTYQIAIVMNARHKTRYFEKQRWPKLWIK